MNETKGAVRDSAKPVHIKTGCPLCDIDDLPYWVESAKKWFHGEAVTCFNPNAHAMKIKTGCAYCDAGKTGLHKHESTPDYVDYEALHVGDIFTDRHAPSVDPVSRTVVAGHFRRLIVTSEMPNFIAKPYNP